MTAAQLAAAMGCPIATAEKFLEPMEEALKRAHIDTPLRLAHWFSQIGHECGGLRYMEEIADGSAYEGRKDLGNTQPGDGKKYKGRGLIQLTGKSNYREFRVWADVNVVENPDLIATDPRLACLSAAWYWAGRGLNRFADTDNVETLTRKINGGLNGLEDRKRRFAIARRVFAESPAVSPAPVS